MFVDLFLLVCFLPREVPLVFIVKLVWRCWILLPTWLQGDWSYPLRCPKSSANVEQVLCEDCFICRCIFDVLVRRDKFHITLFHHLDSSLPAGFLKKKKNHYLKKGPVPNTPEASDAVWENSAICKSQLKSYSGELALKSNLFNFTCIFLFL